MIELTQEQEMFLDFLATTHVSKLIKLRTEMKWKMAMLEQQIELVEEFIEAHGGEDTEKCFDSLIKWTEKRYA